MTRLTAMPTQPITIRVWWRLNDGSALFGSEKAAQAEDSRRRAKRHET